MKKYVQCDKWVVGIAAKMEAGNLESKDTERFVEDFLTKHWLFIHKEGVTSADVADALKGINEIRMEDVEETSRKRTEEVLEEIRF